MATAAERITALEGLVRHLELREKVHTTELEHLRQLAQQLRQVQAEQRSEQRADSDRHREESAKQQTALRDELAKLTTAVSVQRTELDELKKHRDHWSQRAWQIGAGLLLAVVGGVIGYLLKR